MKLSNQEGQRLVAAMSAMRPDWIPNQPGKLLREANDDGGLPSAGLRARAPSVGGVCDGDGCGWPACEADTEPVPRGREALDVDGYGPGSTPPRSGM